MKKAIKKLFISASLLFFLKNNVAMASDWKFKTSNEFKNPHNLELFLDDYLPHNFELAFNLKNRSNSFEFSKKEKNNSIEKLPNELEDKILKAVEIGGGALFAPSCIGPDIPDFHYAQINIRGSFLKSDTKEYLILPKGNFELLGEFANSLIYKGFGNFMTSLNGLIRYNLTPDGWDLEPYIQVGVGVVYTDANKPSENNPIGQSLQFTLQAGAGVRKYIDREKKWSAFVEGKLGHTSNAGIAKKNSGVNASGGIIGIRYDL